MSIIVNCGSGAVKNGSVKQSESNIQMFIKDLKVDLKHVYVGVDDKGRHIYNLSNDKITIEVKIPAIPINEVRYMATKKQNIYDFPRLYIDGSSWLWCYALTIVSDELNKK